MNMYIPTYIYSYTHVYIYIYIYACIIWLLRQGIYGLYPKSKCGTLESEYFLWGRTYITLFYYFLTHGTSLNLSTLMLEKLDFISDLSLIEGSCVPFF